MSVALMEFWLPILVSSIVVFFASFLSHMVMPDEDALLEYMRSIEAPVGQYMFPCCQNWNERKDPDETKRYEAGPHGIVYGLLTAWRPCPRRKEPEPRFPTCEHLQARRQFDVDLQADVQMR